MARSPHRRPRPRLSRAPKSSNETCAPPRPPRAPTSCPFRYRRVLGAPAVPSTRVGRPGTPPAAPARNHGDSRPKLRGGLEETAETAPKRCAVQDGRESGGFGGPRAQQAAPGPCPGLRPDRGVLYAGEPLNTRGRGLVPPPVAIWTGTRAEHRIGAWGAPGGRCGPLPPFADSSSRRLALRLAVPCSETSRGPRGCPAGRHGDEGAGVRGLLPETRAPDGHLREGLREAVPHPGGVHPYRAHGTGHPRTRQGACGPPCPRCPAGPAPRAVTRVPLVAQNGTGKTAAFSIPVLEKIDPQSIVDEEGNTEVGTILAVILVPTRELALQTSQVCKELGKHMGLQIMGERAGSRGVGRSGAVRTHSLFRSPGLATSCACDSTTLLFRAIITCQDPC